MKSQLLTLSLLTLISFSTFAQKKQQKEIKTIVIESEDDTKNGNIEIDVKIDEKGKKTIVKRIKSKDEQSHNSANKKVIVKTLDNDKTISEEELDKLINDALVEANIEKNVDKEIVITKINIDEENGSTTKKGRKIIIDKNGNKKEYNLSEEEIDQQKIDIKSKKNKKGKQIIIEKEIEIIEEK